MPRLEEAPHDGLVVVCLHLPHLVQVLLDVGQLPGVLVRLIHVAVLAPRLKTRLLLAGLALRDVDQLRAGRGLLLLLGGDLVDLELLPDLERVRRDAQVVGLVEPVLLRLLPLVGPLGDLRDDEGAPEHHRHDLPFAEGGVHGPHHVVLQVLGEGVPRAEVPGPQQGGLDLALLQERVDARRPVAHAAAHHGLQQEGVDLVEQLHGTPQRRDQLRDDGVLVQVEGHVANVNSALALVVVALLVLLAASNHAAAAAHLAVVLVEQRAP
mmetsp:Transcript_11786/g.31966  ORF Transcript_11786/g.31966 Transcript_11786/m.31966 type:complete len:267 (+) Transcript_11786:1297-2097(+)